MSAALDFPVPTGPLSRVPSLEVLTHIADEVELADGVRIAGELVPVGACHDRSVTTALADAILARWFRGAPATSGPRSQAPGRRGRDFCRRLSDTLQPYLFRRDAWRFSYRTTDG